MNQKENRPRAGDALGTAYSSVDDYTATDGMTQEAEIDALLARTLSMPPSWMTYDQFELCVVRQFVGMVRDNPPSPSKVKAELLDTVNGFIKQRNKEQPDKQDRWPLRRDLSHAALGVIVSGLHRVVRILWYGSQADGNYDLAVYQTDGPSRGIYVTGNEVIDGLIRQYDEDITTKQLLEVRAWLLDCVPCVKRTAAPNLIAVNNGVYDTDTKTLLPFSPEMVFVSKSNVDYNPNARNVTIHNDDDGTDWDVESWMGELSDDPEVVDLLWQVGAAVIRPNVSWNRSVWLYSEQGNNGKGTFCCLLRNLCGTDAVSGLSLEQLGDKYAPAELIRKSAIICDENKVGGYVDDAAVFKCIVTGDPFVIDRKFQTPITFAFRGLMVQCINELPRFRDTTETLYRRLLLIPFMKCFMGAEREYIKSDYLGRKEVLEYVLKRVLEMDVRRLSEPQACSRLLNEYKFSNDPVRGFVEDIVPQLKWGFVPWRFLYDLYLAWLPTEVPMGKPLQKIKFEKQVRQMLKSGSDWTWNDKSGVKPRNRMSIPEPLINDYQLTQWMNPHYRGPDMDKLCTPNSDFAYKTTRGMERRNWKRPDDNKEVDDD